MDIIYAAEKPSIAKLLGDYVQADVRPEEIDVAENPAQTGSFFIGWRFRRYVLSPAGRIASDARRTAHAASAAVK
jgi:hypothetical protein